MLRSCQPLVEVGSVLPVSAACRMSSMNEAKIKGESRPVATLAKNSAVKPRLAHTPDLRSSAKSRRGSGGGIHIAGCWIGCVGWFGSQVWSPQLVPSHQRRRAGCHGSGYQPGSFAMSPSLSAVEDDHAAGDAARLHGFEAFVDLVEADALRHELVELEPALEVESDVAGHVDPEPVRAHVRALQSLLHQQLEAGDLDALAERDHADHGGR